MAFSLFPPFAISTAVPPQSYTWDQPQGDYIQRNFERFHAENPTVYTKIVELALLAKANGAKKIGIGLLWERLRWHFTFETTGEKFKLNNNYRSRYARLIMAQEPALADFFETRALF